MIGNRGAALSSKEKNILKYIEGEVITKPTVRNHKGKVYVLAESVTFPFTCVNFGTELEAGKWISASPDIFDAPIDGFTYARKNGVWELVSGIYDNSDVLGLLDNQMRFSYNLFDTSSLISSRVNSDGSFSASANSVCTPFFSVPSNEVLTISGLGGVSTSLTRYVIKDDLDNILEVVNGLGTVNSSNITLTTPNVPNISIAITLSTVAGSGTDLINGNSIFPDSFMINIGNVAKPFEPYNKLYNLEVNVFYVDENNGSDLNIGSNDKPFKTIEKAYNKLKGKTGKIYISAGIYENENFNFSQTDTSKIELIGENGVILKFGTKVTSANLENGYTKVYKASGTYTPPTLTSTLFQDGINDDSTEILLNQRHSVHKNKTHRLESTRLTLATDLNDIENSIEPKFIFISNELYFSKVSGSDLTTNPIIIPDVDIITQPFTKISNIEFLYRNLYTYHNLDFNSVKCSFTNRSGFTFNSSSISILNNCVSSGHLNDGFNYNGTAKVFENNCYSHDNLDEASSAHEYVEVTRNECFYEHCAYSITDVGYTNINIKNTIILYCSNPVNFSFSVQTANDIGNATLLNVVTDNSILTNSNGVVRALNCKASTFTPSIIQI